MFQINSKYNEEHAHEVLEWIKTIINEPISTCGDMDNLYDVLHDGQVLCRYILIEVVL